MNDFLRKQLQKKVDKFLTGKDDAFVVSITQWLVYGGVLTGKPKEISDADFDIFRKDIVSDEILVNLISDKKDNGKFFKSLSGTQSDYLHALGDLLTFECFWRLKKVLDNKPTEPKKVSAPRTTKGAEVFTFKKGCHSLDSLHDVMRPLSAVTRKPEIKKDIEKYGLHESDMGDMSDYEIFSKDVKITVEIAD